MPQATAPRIRARPGVVLLILGISAKCYDNSFCGYHKVLGLQDTRSNRSSVALPATRFAHIIQVRYGGFHVVLLNLVSIVLIPLKRSQYPR